jgi:hypothetical protein
MQRRYLDLLACPHCGGPLAASLRCRACAAEYAAPDGIPDLRCAGGQVTETGTRRDRVRGVDRNSDDKSPKNLTKKLKRGSKSGAPRAAAEAAPEAEAKGKPAKTEKPRGDKPKGEKPKAE